MTDFINVSVKCRDTSCYTVRAINWEDLNFQNGSNTWPNPSGNFATVTDQPATQVLAIRFNTSTNGGTTYGRFSSAEAAGVPEPRDMSISEQPGDFEFVHKNCIKTNFADAGTIYWEIDNDVGDTSACQLQKGATGKTYYVNIRFPSGCGDLEYCYHKVGNYKGN